MFRSWWSRLWAVLGVAGLVLTFAACDPSQTTTSDQQPVDYSTITAEDNALQLHLTDKCSWATFTEGGKEHALQIISMGENDRVIKDDVTGKRSIQHYGHNDRDEETWMPAIGPVRRIGGWARYGQNTNNNCRDHHGITEGTFEIKEMLWRDR